MSDTKLQAIRRQAATGDPQAEAALLRERLRNGEECEHCWCMGCVAGFPGKHDACSLPTPCPRCADLLLRERVELAAYCGSEAARKALGVLHIPGGANGPGCWSLDEWIHGLSRWPHAVSVRAACAAARVAYTAWCGVNPPETGVDLAPPWLAIEAAEVWIKCPDEEHKAAWRAAFATGGGTQPPWSPAPDGPYDEAQRVDEILAAARATSEPAVREAICAALVEWALA